MAQIRHPHLFLTDNQTSQPFTTRRRGRGSATPSVNRETHSSHLKEQWAAIWARAREEDASRTAVSYPGRGGVYVEFEGVPGYELVTKSLDSHSKGIRLLNVHKIPIQDDSENIITRATVFIPTGKQDIFLNKLNAYADEENPSGTPKNEPLMQSINNIRTAILESLWTDDRDLIPGLSAPVWCEIWLSSAEIEVEEKFRSTAKSLGIEIQKRVLRFPERSVLLGQVTKGQLVSLLDMSPNIAEFRRAKETPRFFLELENKDQTEWVEDLSSRLTINNQEDVSVCILDTGANNGHVLLEPLLADADCQSVDPDWGIADKDGHGTLMCGLSAYGDLTEILQDSGSVEVRHKLESVKILAKDKSNDPDLYGELTIQGISRAEIQSPDSKRICCMAVTSEDNRDRGKPSSWSAAIDKVTSGYDDDIKRLMIVSGGNVHSQDDWKNYPQSNLQSSIHDPGQAWNALTVGAYTTKAQISDPDISDYIPVTMPECLSPFSSTSSSWEPKWPIKPEIVLEGGNLICIQDGSISEHEDLSLLSTNYKPQISQFEMMNATSAASALAGRMAAQIQSYYPNAWPETIRGLLVHSSSWTNMLLEQFCQPDRYGNITKTEAGKLLRICGYGVPDRDKAISCFSNSLTLISESEFQPYEKRGSTYHTKDMHIYNLPWPKDELLSLGETPVKLRITLSYFIEPGPGEVGWKDRYRYSSFGLRFALNRVNEAESEFSTRLSADIRINDEDEVIDNDTGSERWVIGSNSRDVGSIHSDIWVGTAAEIASCNLIGVYPVIGWWRERNWLNRWDRKTRYSLIVSLETPRENVDIYTPVAVKIDTPVIEVEI